MRPAAEPMHVETDVLIIGSGGAGMYAAIEAARRGCSTFLIDRSLIGRGGATVMAQMTVAVALGEQTPDHWGHHLRDTLEAGRGLCDERLAHLLCEEGADCIREMDRWGVGWARRDGRICQVMAPGHDRPRCVYVDFLNTGPAVSKTLRGVVTRAKDIRRAGDLVVVDLALADGEVVGATALHLPSGAPVTIAAKATILATGGLTRLYRRNSASANMGGDGYALALRAGAPIFCDAKMIASGITRTRLPAANEIICTLDHPSVPALAAQLGTTRSAAAIDLWRDQLAGAVVAIGNAPTALFHLLERLDQGWPRPAAIIGVPVGFVGASESKEELVRDNRGVPYLAVRGRRGGSAMAVAAVNAIASERE